MFCYWKSRTVDYHVSDVSLPEGLVYRDSFIHKQKWSSLQETYWFRGLITGHTMTCQYLPLSSHDSPVVVSICGSTWDYHPHFLVYICGYEAAKRLPMGPRCLGYFYPYVGGWSFWPIHTQQRVESGNPHQILILPAGSLITFPLNTQLKNIILIHTQLCPMTQLWHLHSLSPLSGLQMCRSATWPRGK